MPWVALSLPVWGVEPWETPEGSILEWDRENRLRTRKSIRH